MWEGVSQKVMHLLLETIWDNCTFYLYYIYETLRQAESISFLMKRDYMKENYAVMSFVLTGCIEVFC